MGIIELNTQRLLLTEITLADLPDLHDLKSKPELAKYNTFPIPKHLDDTKAHVDQFIENQTLAARTKYLWVIRKKTNGTFLGDCGMSLKVAKYKSAEIHYGLMPEFWGNGFASEASRAMVEFCFQSLNLHRVEAGVAVENSASIKLLENLGFKREGQHRKILPLPSGWSDNYSYALLHSD